MRNLTPTGLHIAGLNHDGPSTFAGNLAIDPENGSIYVAVQKDAEGVEVEIIQVDLDGSKRVVGTLSSPVRAPFPIPEYASEILDLHYFPDDQSLAVLLSGGDIGTLQLDTSSGQAGEVDIVGSIDSGIKAAAWSPDDEQLILVTGEDTLVCMTRTFDVIHEEPLRSEDFGEDKFINVGWGSKATQFHGSLGKTAAQTPSTSSSPTPTSLSHPTDISLPIISFRGDAAYFAISSLDPHPSSPSHSRRQIRIYSREASSGFIPRLSATSESLPGLEPWISWRPSGNLIAGLVRYGYEGGGSGKEGKWDVAMIERNGLRHGGFELREGKSDWESGRVRGMSWNSDSEVLAIWIERKEEDVVQLWSMKNYHYYLKQELFSHKEGNKRFRGFKWHTEQPLTIFILGDNYVQARTFVWDTYTARLPMPKDTATVAVVDGDRLLVTPFRTQNVPPPMPSYTLSLRTTPVHVAVSNTEDALAVIYRDGTIQLWDLNTRIPEPKGGSKLRGGGKVAMPELRFERHVKLQESLLVKQLALGKKDEVAILIGGGPGDTGDLALILAGEKEKDYTLDTAVEKIVWSEHGLLALAADGHVTSVTAHDEFSIDVCAHPQSVAVSPSPSLLFALSSTGKLHLASLSKDEYNSPSIIASSVTSFSLTPDFLIYATASQSSYYAPLTLLHRIATGEDVSASEREWETRRVERGSLIVAACPSSMSLVLQMPRGNLETVYPRALVLAVVKRDVLAGSYRDAFVTCRKHRLDVNLVYDIAPEKLLADLEEFVNQVPEVDYLNFFVTSFKEADVAKELYRDAIRAESSARKDKVNPLCDALRGILEQRDLVKYTETILTTHVCKIPADYESGLRVLLQLQSEHSEVVEDAIKYIIFLSDVNKLYDVALGMYDFKLVLMVAQYSQKDPKEYLPFLRELRALDKWEQRFRIDDHLERRESALRNLRQAGADRFDDAASYLARYELYDEAFRIYAEDEDRLPAIRNLYGDYLYDRRDFYEAALSYTMANKAEKALKAYEKAHAWRELFALALSLQKNREELVEMSSRVTDHLASRGRHIEASQVYLDYADDVDSAVDVLCRGAEFAEAYRIASIRNRSDLVESYIHPGLEEAQEVLSETFDEMNGQLKKEMSRIEELRQVRQEDPDTFYIVDNEPALEGVDVATNATTAASAFTRYTVAPTTVFSQTTKMTGQTAKSKHKASRRRATGRKGTVDEYEYLLASIGRLVARVEEKSAEALPLLRYLLIASPPHRDLAIELQSSIIDLRDKLAVSILEAWRERDIMLDEAAESGGMGLNGDVQKAREIEMPVVPPWKGLGVLAV